MGKFMTTGVMSSLRDDWATPNALFTLLDSIFHFTLDPCSTEENHLCEKHYTKEDDGLSHSWKGEVVFMNPPYGKNMGAWISKALAESVGGGCLVVGLVPARTDTRWWQNCIQDHADVVFIRGRLKYGDGSKGAPFPSAIVLWWGKDAVRNGGKDEETLLF